MILYKFSPNDPLSAPVINIKAQDVSENKIVAIIIERFLNKGLIKQYATFCDHLYVLLSYDEDDEIGGGLSSAERIHQEILRTIHECGIETIPF